MPINRETKFIVILALLILFLVFGLTFFKKNIEAADAKRFVEEDMKSKYPRADIEIINALSKINDNKEVYFEVKAKVTRNPETSCPQRIHIYYNYPAQNFVPQSPEYITKDCIVCKEEKCVIAFPEEAIIASHTVPGTEEVKKFVMSQPYPSPKVTRGDAFWLVKWEGSSTVYEVFISRNGRLLNFSKKTIK